MLFQFQKTTSNTGIQIGVELDSTQNVIVPDSVKAVSLGEPKVMDISGYKEMLIKQQQQRWVDKILKFGQNGIKSIFHRGWQIDTKMIFYGIHYFWQNRFSSSYWTLLQDVIDYF